MRNLSTFFYFFVIGLVMISGSHAKDGILVVTEEWPPFNYMEDGKITGFSTELVTRILKIMNKEYKIRMLPSMRTTHLLNTRPKTIMFSMFRTPERDLIYKWVGPLCDGSIFFYKRRDRTIKIESLEDIKKVNRVACRQEGLIPKLLLKKGFTNLDKTATNSLQIYEKLLRGRCDLAISDTDLGVAYSLKQLNTPMDVVEKIPIKIYEAELYIAFSRDIPDKDIQQWQSALDKLKTDGIYENIFHKYVTDKKKPTD